MRQKSVKPIRDADLKRYDTIPRSQRLQNPKRNFKIFQKKIGLRKGKEKSQFPNPTHFIGRQPRKHFFHNQSEQRKYFQLRQNEILQSHWLPPQTAKPRLRRFLEFIKPIFHPTERIGG